MNQPEIIKIDDIEYVHADSVQRSGDHNSSVKIVVLQRGWVMIGHYQEIGDKVILDNASVIERWGTTEGLGQLINGPLTETRLRYAGHVEAHQLGVILTISVKDSAWLL